MTNVIKNNIPNTVTCLNLFSGCIACVMAFEAKYELALLFIVLSSIFDFFDGLLARALNAHSIIGKDLDSLADDVSFGVVLSGNHGVYCSLPTLCGIFDFRILRAALGQVQ